MNLKRIVNDIEVHGYRCSFWIKTFFACHNSNGFGGFTQWCTPDGKPYLNQSNVSVEIFQTIENRVIKESEKSEKARKARNGNSR